MKQLTIIVISFVIGALLGIMLGINIGREKPLLSNPFEKESLSDVVKKLGHETMEKSGKALEKTGKALQGK